MDSGRLPPSGPLPQRKRLTLPEPCSRSLVARRAAGSSAPLLLLWPQDNMVLTDGRSGVTRKDSEDSREIVAHRLVEVRQNDRSFLEGNRSRISRMSITGDMHGSCTRVPVTSMVADTSGDIAVAVVLRIAAIFRDNPTARFPLAAVARMVASSLDCLPLAAVWPSVHPLLSRSSADQPPFRRSGIGGFQQDAAAASDSLHKSQAAGVVLGPGAFRGRRLSS